MLVKWNQWFFFVPKWVPKGTQIGWASRLWVPKSIRVDFGTKVSAEFLVPKSVPRDFCYQKITKSKGKSKGNKPNPQIFAPAAG